MFRMNSSSQMGQLGYRKPSVSGPGRLPCSTSPRRLLVYVGLPRPHYSSGGPSIRDSLLDSFRRQSSALRPETVMAAQVSTTAFSATVGANIWHKRLGHPNKQLVERARHNAESGANSQTFSACGTCKSTDSSSKLTSGHRAPTAPVNVFI